MKGSKAIQKMHELARVTTYMPTAKNHLPVNAFFQSWFSYCPLVRMFYSGTQNNRINKFRGRYLPIIYSDKISNFEERSVSVITLTLQALDNEISSI